MSNFITDLMAGRATAEQFDDYVDAWHESDSSQHLAAFLGLTREEYTHVAPAPTTRLPDVVMSRKFETPPKGNHRATRRHDLASRPETDTPTAPATPHQQGEGGQVARQGLPRENHAF